MRRRGWIVLGSSLLGCALLYVVALRLARSMAVDRLQRRGLSAHIGSVRPRLLGVGLRDVEWVHESGRIKGHFDDVRVDLGMFGVRRIGVYGGAIEAHGSLREVRDAVGSSDANGLPETNSDASVLPVYAEGLALQWAGLFSGGDDAASALSLDGLSALRDGSGVEVKVARASVRGLGLEGNAELLLAKIGSDLGLRSLQAKSAQASVDLDVFRRAIPESVPRAAPSAPLQAKRHAVAATNDDTKQNVLKWVSLSPGRGARFRDSIRRFAGIVRRRLPSDGALELGQVTLSVRHGAQSLSIGPGRVYGRRDLNQLKLGFASGSGDEPSPFEISAEIPVDDGPVEARVRGGPVALSVLGVKAGDFGLQEVSLTKLAIDSQVTLSADGARADFSSSGELADLAVQHERLAPHALTGITFGWELDGHLNVDGSQFDVKSGRVRFGKVESQAKISLNQEAKHLVLDADLRIDAGSCEEMFAALPQGAAPLLRGGQMKGDFSWRGGIQLDTDHLSDVRAIWQMRNRCRFSRIPEDASPAQFRSRFSMDVPGPDGELMALNTGPGSRNWTPIQEVSPFMEVAVLTTEDGGFWSHHGFDSGAIQSAIERNVSSGKFTRGASTISMQLAKNLYLERDKYIARKVQEALLTMLLEQELSKPQILELYLNIIEYGPGVYGIRNAAKHYFNSLPGELSIAQCFFLASILPKPKARYFEEDGNLSANRTRLVRTLMKIALGRKRIGPEDLERGLSENLRFGVPHLETNPYRNADGSTIDDPFYPGGADEMDELP